MKINIIIPFLSSTGGIRVILEYANRLQQSGNDVVLYMPIIPYRFTNKGVLGVLRLIKSLLKNIKKNIKWFDNKVTLKKPLLISNEFIRDADIVIATAWPTAYSVNKLNNSKGKKVYFIQHYEIWSGPKNLVDNSYRLDFEQITISIWIKNLLVEKFNSNNVEIIYNGNDFGVENTVKQFNRNIVVLMMYHSLKWKGFKEGLKAFEIAKKKFPEIKLVLFGTHKGEDVPKYAEFHENPTREELKKLYLSADIYLFPSKFEGWGLTVIEAMSLKCAVVGTNVGCINDIGIHKKTAMISSPDDIQGMANNLIELIENKYLLATISKNGFEKVKGFTWENSSKRFETLLKSLLK